MWYIVAFSIGILVGIVYTSMTVINGNTERVEEAYNLGYEDGKRITEQVNANKNSCV